MKKIKVLFTIPNFDTAGTGLVLFDILKKINLSEFEPHILCKHNNGALFKKVEELNFPIHIFDYTCSMSKKLRGLINAFKISRKLRKIKPDIIYSLNYNDDYSEALAARLAGIKFIYSKKNMSWQGRGWKFRTFFSNGVIVQNTDMLGRFFNNNSKAFFIPFGVELSEFSTGAKPARLFTEFNINPNYKIILSVANLVPIKGFELLILSFEKLVEKHSDIFLLLVGNYDNEYGMQVKELCSKSKFADRILMPGKRTDMNDIYRLADIYVQPTLNKGRMEGSPISTMEAMACQVLVVGSDIPGIKDQLSDTNYQLFKAGNETDLTEKLEYWLSADESIKSAAIAKQLEKIKKIFNVDVSVSEHEKYFKKIAGK